MTGEARGINVPEDMQSTLRSVLQGVADWPEPEGRTDGTRCPVSGALATRCRSLAAKETLTLDDLDALIGFMVNGGEAAGDIVAAFVGFYRRCGGTAKASIVVKPA